MHNKCYFSSVVPFRLSLFGFFVVQSAVVVVRLRDQISFFELNLATQFFGGMLVAAFLFLNISSTLLKNSEDIVDKMMIDCWVWVKKERKLLLRRVQALQPFGVRSSPNKGLNFDGMLHYFVMVISGVTTVLVSLKSLQNANSSEVWGFFS